jgi:hypothetical protein
MKVRIMPHYPALLVETAGLTLPVVGLYDAPDASAFEPLIRPAQGRWACVFMFYKSWLRGETLHLTKENFGCGGAGTYLFDVSTRSQQEMIDFLYGTEGLKASAEVTAEWIDRSPHYQPLHPNILIGPIKDDQYEHLKTATFFVNPDQLSLFITAAYYRQGRPTPPRVTAPFSSGCGQLGPLFEDLDRPDAMISATDIAVRKYLPPDVLAFTVTKSMYEQLCTLDENSFLGKPFWREVQKARAQQKSWQCLQS